VPDFATAYVVRFRGSLSGYRGPPRWDESEAP